MSIFEIGMLVCFGFSWPFSLLKTWRMKTGEGKSFLFLWLVFIGYLFGIAHKVLYKPDMVIILYAINALMVFVDMMLSYHYRRVIRQRAASMSQGVSAE